jgi:hypothetical protein
VLLCVGADYAVLMLAVSITCSGWVWWRGADLQRLGEEGPRRIQVSARGQQHTITWPW